MSATLEHALALTSAGYPVFPCYPRGSGVGLDKSPLVSGWRTLTAGDAAGLCASWWSQWPGALIAVPTGGVSGLWVVDLDVRPDEGKDGHRSLRELGLTLPATRVHHTSRGGAHLLYRAPPGAYCVTNNNTVAPGVDLKGDGGYIIWWPAHDGAVTDGPFAEPPEWMMAYTGREGGTGESKPPMGLDDDAIDEVMAMVPPASMGDRGPWIRLGMALHHETDGDLYGLQVWNDWSSRWPKYEGLDACEREWNTFGRGRRATVTMRSYIPRGWRPGMPTAAQAFAGGGVAAQAFAGGTVTQPVIAPIAGETLLLPAAQAAYFANCVYVASIHRILTPDGEVYDQQRFNAMYGGRSFVMDPTNARTVRSAWECFLESQALTFPKVSGRLFRPELPAYSIVSMEGATYVNTYVPIETRAVEGDPEPFLRLLRKLLPDERDRNILLTYMASMLRNPGVKFQWWPVIQGTEGNGKSALFYVMTHCVGHRYTEELNVAEMAKNGIKFNSWIVGTLLLIMEEIYVENRRHFLEEFKPTVTNKRIAVEQKGVDKTTEDNRANGMMGTNHQDGVPITVDSRRYAIFYTAQQSAEDKLRDGMTPKYFADLYDWLNGVGAYESGGACYGCSVVNWWLRTQYVLVDEFDPARGCQVAPKTSSSAAAIKNSMGPIEQDILEAIESDQEGFRGGWISGTALDRLFEKGRRTLARNKRRAMLQALGYDWHPHLREGRTTHGNPLKGHPGKFNLYCKLNSEISEIKDNAKIMERYFIDQRL